jgi:glycerol-3-phosphate acyltransferase PlsY
MIVAAFMAGTSVGAAAMIVTLGIIAVTRYLSLGTVGGAIVYVMVSVLAVDNSLLLRLALFTAGLVLLRHIPALIRLVRRTEPRLSLEKDITYKLDE